MSLYDCYLKLKVITEHSFTVAGCQRSDVNLVYNQTHKRESGELLYIDLWNDNYVSVHRHDGPSEFHYSNAHRNAHP